MTAISVRAGPNRCAGLPPGMPSTASKRRALGDATDAEDPAHRGGPAARGAVAPKSAASRSEFVDHVRHALSLDALTIGFARRFATYKRANLVLRDLEGWPRGQRRKVPFNSSLREKLTRATCRARKCCGSLQLLRDLRFAGKMLFIEDYDINVGRYLVQGVDVWLNTPRRPLEASGTSGQKVVLNGGLNLSILDGWWAEAYDGHNGFAIGRGETHSSIDRHDARDAEALARVLRDEVIPLYYDRDSDGLPRRWIARMKRAIRTSVAVSAPIGCSPIMF